MLSWSRVLAALSEDLSSLNLEFAHWLNWLANELQGSSCLFASTGIIHASHHILTPAGAENLNSGVHAYTAGTSPSELPPQPHQLDF